MTQEDIVIFVIYLSRTVCMLCGGADDSGILTSGV